MLEILKNPQFDFLSKARYFIGASILIIQAGLAYMLSTHTYMGRNPKGYGVEFSGGTQAIAQLSTPRDVDHVRAALNAVDSNAVIQIIAPPAEGRVLIRLAATS